MEHDLSMVFWGILLGACIGYFIAATFYFNSYDFQVTAKGECAFRGYYNLDLEKDLNAAKAQANSCEQTLSNCIWALRKIGAKT